ncbi:FAS1-like dehydratase domain-containing protein [Streptomyces mirabilis]|uniref:MaoC family dehydratase n=1 Tax=Streptomyces mirabilis TaxID=68239 RepID=UPI0033A96141
MQRITTLNEFEKAYREGLDVPLHPRPWREATTEWLRRHSEGSGDHNPLYRDHSYAADARFHSLTGSPSFLFSIDFGATASIWGHIPHSAVAMNDLSILYLGADIEWFRPVWVSDRVRSIETPVGIRRREMPQLGDALVCSGRTEYYNHRSELVGRITNHMLRFVNPKAGVSASPARRDGQVAPDPLVWQRTRRGGEPLHWEDVHEGDALPHLPKGTYTTTELYLFSYGTLTIARAAQVDEGTIDMGAGGRADPEYARRSRAQATTFDYGPQRITWLSQLVTDWMGDWGDLLTLSAQLRRPNLIGDTNTIVGSVERVYREADEGRVDVRVAVVNQDDVETAVAEATVRLPVRELGQPREAAVLWAPAAAAEPTLYG